MRPGSKKGLYSAGYLTGKTVLFTVSERTSYGFAWMVGGIHEGDVESVYPNRRGVRKRVLVRFWHASVSNTMPVWFEHIIAVFDKERGTEMEIDGRSGKLIDLRRIKRQKSGRP